MATNHPLADKRIRSLVGIAGATIVAVVALLFLDGPIMYLALGIAALDAIITPYILRRALEEE